MNDFDPYEFVNYLALVVWGLALGAFIIGVMFL